MSKPTQRKPIQALAAGATSLSLDDTYGTPTGGSSRGRTLYSIDAYSDAGAVQKEKFLSDAARYARMVARELFHFGFREHEVRTNRAGIAVSGEVYAEVFHPEHQRWVFFWIESTFGTLSLRQDTVVITARWREHNSRFHHRGRPCVDDGPNQLISASLDTYSVAVRLLPLLGMNAADFDVAPTQQPAPRKSRARRTPPTPREVAVPQPLSQAAAQTSHPQFQQVTLFF